ncbi:hypothetical protein [Actinoplanes sp. NPDC089786]|uniref:hypothetical protein n=1 Tax=Actinoplanes sp. NPDC089786 TaxID=3155185 RepID=UPI0034264B68
MDRSVVAVRPSTSIARAASSGPPSVCTISSAPPPSGKPIAASMLASSLVQSGPHRTLAEVPGPYSALVSAWRR